MDLNETARFYRSLNEEQRRLFDELLLEEAKSLLETEDAKFVKTTGYHESNTVVTDVTGINGETCTLTLHQDWFPGQEDLPDE